MFKSQEYTDFMIKRFHNNKEDYLYRIYLRMKNRYVINNTGCQEFTGVKNNRGYGLISFNYNYNKRTTMAAHRFIYWQHTKQDIDDKVVMHTCDNLSCINIDHLRLGTQSDNMKDMWIKGRSNSTANHLRQRRIRKLTDADVRYIRHSVGPLKEVATRCNISLSYVSKLRNGKAKQLVS